MDRLRRLALLFLTYERAEKIKTLLAGALYYSGAATLTSFLRPPGGAILMYHSVADRGVFWDNAMPLAKFEEHVRYLRSRFEIVPVSKIVERVRNGQKVPSNWVAITFDDGYRDNLAAAEILHRAGATGSFYAAVGVVDRAMSFYYDQIQKILESTSKGKVFVAAAGRSATFRLSTPALKRDAVLRITLMLRNLPPADRAAAVARLASEAAVPVPTCDDIYLSHDDLRRLESLGMEVGSHSVTHANLARLAPDELRKEVADSRWRLGEILGKAVPGIAYPFGKPAHVGAMVERAAADAGYAYGLGTVPGRVHAGSNLFYLPRISAKEGETLVRLKARMAGVPL